MLFIVGPCFSLKFEMSRKGQAFDQFQSLPKGGFSMKTSVQYMIHLSFAYCFNNDGGSNFLAMSLSGQTIRGLCYLDKFFIHVLKIFEQVP